MYPLQWYEYWREEDIRADLSILRFLREAILSGDIEHISLREPYRQGLFSTETHYSWEHFRRRALYQLWRGFVEPLMTKDILEERMGRRAGETLDTGFLHAIRLTPEGFMYIETLEMELHKYVGFSRHITKVREWNEKFVGIRGGLIIGITILLIICVFVFDIRVSKVIQKIPLLSSIIDTKLLEEFEAINEQDDFYTSVTQAPVVLDFSQDVSSTSPQNDIIPINASWWVAKVFPQVIHDILPKDTKVENVAVRNIAPLEKLFKISLDGGKIQYIQVKKENDKYIIVNK